MKLRLIHKIIIPFLGIFLAFGIFLTNMVVQSGKVTEAGDRVEHLTENQELLFTFRNNVSRLLMVVNDFIITGKTKYKNDFYFWEDKLHRDINKLEGALVFDDEKVSIYDIHNDLNKIITAGGNIIEKVESRDPAAAAELMEKMDYFYGEDLFEKLDTQISSLSNEIRFTKSKTSDYRKNLFNWLYLSGIFVVIIFIITAVLTIRHISKPILYLTKAARKISKGDYSVRPKVDTKDEISLLANTFSNMAESIKQKEKLIEDNRRFLENIVKTIPSGLIVVKKENKDILDTGSFGANKIILANRAFYKMFETDKENIIGKEIKEVLTEINLSDFCRNVVVKGKAIENIQCECALPTNKKLSLDLSLAGFELEEENILIVFHNITDIKKAEEIIRLEKEKAQRYLDVADVILMVVDPNETISLINKKGQEILGCDENEIVGKNWFDNFIKADEKEEIRKVFFSIIMGEKEAPEYYENEVLTKNGGSRIIAWHNVTLRDEKGNIIGILSSGEDITEKRKAEELLKKYTEELKMSNEQKDKFFSIISHDLRSPFNGLLGYANLLVEDINELDSEEIEEYARSILAISNKLYDHLNHILEWSRIQRDKIDYSPSRINLYEIVENIMSLLSANADKKNIELLVNVSPEIFVKADKYMLTSILQNLISNAIKFTPQNGKITIEAVLKNSAVEVTVQDTGIGMTEDDIEKVFKIDTTFSTRGTDNEEGTGLGLIICKEMVERHGSKLIVNSKQGEGTKFKFTLELWDNKK